jgi:tetratricopeptide (TPR) repeat protein
LRKIQRIPAAYIRIAHIWTGAKQYDTAVTYLKKAISLNPNDAQAYKDLIEIYIRLNKFDEVTPLLSKYVSLMGDDVEAKVRLVKFLTSRLRIMTAPFSWVKNY